MTDLTERDFAGYAVRYRGNPRFAGAAAEADGTAKLLDGKTFETAWNQITAWPGYAPTPLRSLAGLASAVGIGAIFYKDESARFGLGSFKALGGAYAVFRQLAASVRRETGVEQITTEDLIEGRYRAITSRITATCATDGNHGRSVAWGAQMFGCRCVIFVHETVSAGRVRAIEAYGAEVRRVPGTYDDAVRQAAADAARNGWIVVSDTSYPGYRDIPRDVMLGYAVMVEEALAQLPHGQTPSHAFVQAGVGGLAAAVCAHLQETLGPERPRVIVVEPEKAACLLASAEAGQPVAVGGALDTIMAGLACGEPSLLAWEVLGQGADGFMAIPDAAAAAAMRMLAAGVNGDPPLVAGESAVAGLAALLCACAQPRLRQALGLSADSRILLIGSEGATDPEVYRNIVGSMPEEVAADRP